MSEQAREFIRRQSQNGAEVRGDYLVWSDGRYERITDPRYWLNRSEIQHRLKGETISFGPWGEVYFFRTRFA